MKRTERQRAWGRLEMTKRDEETGGQNRRDRVIRQGTEKRRYKEER